LGVLLVFSRNSPVHRLDNLPPPPRSPKALRPHGRSSDALSRHECPSVEKTRDGDGGGDDEGLSAMEVRGRTEDGRERTEELRMEKLEWRKLDVIHGRS
jgi:hypothetical protein